MEFYGDISTKLDTLLSYPKAKRDALLIKINDRSWIGL